MSPPPPTSEDELLGSTVEGRYRVLALLGRGGMCSVYRAVDSRSGVQVALKVLPAERATDTEMAARFQREAAAGKRIAHANVCAISDSGSLKDGSLYLVMELLDGVSLGSVLDRGRLPTERALGIARQMLLGLGAAHELSITHRDVKPDNVMLTEQDTVKLVDFGIASNERAAFKLTAVGLAFGTPEYISPEMAMGLAVDPRADLYAVGVVLYQMVTGRLPFAGGGDVNALLRAHIDSAPPPPRQVASGISVELEALILRALEKLPEKRFPTAEAMIQSIDAVLARDRQRRARRAMMIVAALLLLALLGGALWMQQEPPTAPDSPVKKSRIRRSQAK